MTSVNLLIFGKQLVYMKVTQKSQNFYLRIRQMQNVLKILRKSFLGQLIYVVNVIVFHYHKINHLVRLICLKIQRKKY
jgi:hypothetical protein